MQQIPQQQHELQQNLQQQNVQQTAPSQQTTAVYWFRHDLRLSDNPALTFACQQSCRLALVVCLPKDQHTRWGFTRVGQHRKVYLADTVRELAAQCELLGHRLLVIVGDPVTQLPLLLRKLNTNTLYCEEIAAPEEVAQVESLRQQAILVNGFQIQTHLSAQVFTTWQSSLLQPSQLPFAITELPLVFTTFRNQLEKTGCRPLAPLPRISQLPAMPEQATAIENIDLYRWAGVAAADPRSALPYQQLCARAGETAAQQHLQQYFQSGLARHYKETRNGLIGFDYSTKFSPWLASGAVSARQIFAHLAAHEAEHGQNDSTYWIWFELLWRDYFRFLHLRFGQQLYLAQGLKKPAQLQPTSTSTSPHSARPKTIPHHPEQFQRWCSGTTGQPLIDAGMRELAATGYLSNRMRQIVASFLVNDLQCDWRAGAAWFESQLIDYDVYSNQGNWLYLAGFGTDPRSNRRFNLDKQQQTYDPDQAYLKLWLET